MDNFDLNTEDIQTILTKILESDRDLIIKVNTNIPINIYNFCGRLLTKYYVTLAKDEKLNKINSLFVAFILYIDELKILIKEYLHDFVYINDTIHIGRFLMFLSFFDSYCLYYEADENCSLSKFELEKLKIIMEKTEEKKILLPEKLILLNKS